MGVDLDPRPLSTPSLRRLRQVCCSSFKRLFSSLTLSLSFFLSVSLVLLLQVVYFTEMHKIFSELTEQIDQAGLTDEQRERETEAKLSELRALSIVADD